MVDLVVRLLLLRAAWLLVKGGFYLAVGILILVDMAYCKLKGIK